MSAAMYASALRSFVTGDLDWENDDIRLLLVSDRYEPNQAGDRFRTAVALAETPPSGTYPSGGVRLTGRAVQPDGPLGTRMVGGSVSLAGFTGEFRYAVIYKAVGADQRDVEELVSVTDLGVQRLSDADVSLAFPSDGICVFAAEALA